MSTAQLQAAADQQLMAAYQRGDERAFRRLFEQYAPLLQRYFMRHGKSRCEATDLVQHTFLKLHRTRADFCAEQALRPWLFTIARNARHDHSRRRQRRPEHYCDLDLQPCPEPSADALLQERRARALRVALDSLPETQQALLREHWLEERSWTEIASRRGTQAVTLRVRAHRACLQLRDRLDAGLASAA
jgi:RNA polymerase sigma-70 factor, ECF subfamily